MELTAAVPFLSYRWNAIEVDGHNIEEIIKAFDAAKACKGKPTALLAKTFKGFAWENAAEGISDLMGWHGKPLGNRAEDVLAKIKAHTKNMDAFIPPAMPNKTLSPPDLAPILLSQPPTYAAADKVKVHVPEGRFWKTDATPISLQRHEDQTALPVKRLIVTLFWCMQSLSIVQNCVI